MVSNCEVICMEFICPHVSTRGCHHGEVDVSYGGISNQLVHVCVMLVIV